MSLYKTSELKKNERKNITKKKNNSQKNELKKQNKKNKNLYSFFLVMVLFIILNMVFSFCCHLCLMQRELLHQKHFLNHLELKQNIRHNF